MVAPADVLAGPTFAAPLPWKSAQLGGRRGPNHGERPVAVDAPPAPGDRVVLPLAAREVHHPGPWPQTEPGSNPDDCKVPGAKVPVGTGHSRTRKGILGQPVDVDASLAPHRQQHPAVVNSKSPGAYEPALAAGRTEPLQPRPRAPDEELLLGRGPRRSDSPWRAQSSSQTVRPSGKARVDRFAARSNAPGSPPGAHGTVHVAPRRCGVPWQQLRGLARAGRGRARA